MDLNTVRYPEAEQLDARTYKVVATSNRGQGECTALIGQLTDICYLQMKYCSVELISAASD